MLMATSLLLGNASMEKRDHALIINTYINAYHDKTHGPLTRATLTAPLDACPLTWTSLLGLFMEQRDHACLAISWYASAIALDLLLFH
jgi:hypothetical protein